MTFGLSGAPWQWCGALRDKAANKRWPRWLGRHQGMADRDDLPWKRSRDSPNLCICLDKINLGREKWVLLIKHWLGQRAGLNTIAGTGFGCEPKNKSWDLLPWFSAHKMGMWQRTIPGPFLYPGFLCRTSNPGGRGCIKHNRGLFPFPHAVQQKQVVLYQGLFQGCFVGISI